MGVKRVEQGGKCTALRCTSVDGQWEGIHTDCGLLMWSPDYRCKGRYRDPGLGAWWWAWIGWLCWTPNTGLDNVCGFSFLMLLHQPQRLRAQGHQGLLQVSLLLFYLSKYDSKHELIWKWWVVAIYAIWFHLVGSDSMHALPQQWSVGLWLQLSLEIFICIRHDLQEVVHGRLE